MAPYTTIIFDLSEVLINFVIPLGEELSGLLNIPVKAVYWAFENDHMLSYYRGLITEDEFLPTVLERLDGDITIVELKQIIRRSLETQVPGLQPILEALKENYELVLLSDHGIEWVEHVLQVHPFLKIFDQKYFSFDLDGIKEQPEVFERLLKQIERQPGECLFVDDREHNCEIARSLGIDAIRFVSAKDLIEALDKHDITLKL